MSSSVQLTFVDFLIMLQKPQSDIYDGAGSDLFITSFPEVKNRLGSFLVNDHRIIIDIVTHTATIRSLFYALQCHVCLSP